MLMPEVATDFLYDQERLSFFNMILCKFENSGMETVSAGSNLTFNTIKPVGSDKFYLASSKYDEALSTTLQICKDPCKTDNKTISSRELSTIMRWLNRKDGFHKFKLYQQGYEDIWFKGSFNNIQEIKIGGQICGLELTLTTDSAYGYLDTVDLTFTTSANTPISLTNFSFETGYIYPTVFTCKCLTSGNLVITNALEDRETIINNCIKDEIISLDGEHKIINTSVPTHNLYNDFNYKYFRLTNSYYDNLNPISTNLPCEIHIEYNPIRKVGIG